MCTTPSRVTTGKTSALLNEQVQPEIDLHKFSLWNSNKNQGVDKTCTVTCIESKQSSSHYQKQILYIRHWKDEEIVPYCISKESKQVGRITVPYITTKLEAIYIRQLVIRILFHTDKFHIKCGFMHINNKIIQIVSNGQRHHC